MYFVRLSCTLRMIIIVGFAISLGGCLLSHQPNDVSTENTVLAVHGVEPLQIQVLEQKYKVRFVAETGLPGFNFDTGYWPSNSPVQLRLILRANPPRTRIELPGRIVVRYPSWVKPGQNASLQIFFEGETNAGYLLDAFGFRFSTMAKLKIPNILEWEGPIPIVPQMDLDVTVDTKTDRKPYTPFLLGRTFTASDEGSWTFGLKNFGIKNVVQITVGLDLGATVTSTLGGVQIRGMWPGGSTVWNTEGAIRSINVNIPQSAPSGSRAYAIPLTCVYSELFKHRYQLWGRFIASVLILNTMEIINLQSPKLLWNIPTTLVPEKVDLPDSRTELSIFLNVDGIKPTLSNVTITPSSLPPSGGNVTIRVTAADAHSGVATVKAILTGPNGWRQQISLARTSGSAASGVWSATVVIPQNRSGSKQQYKVSLVVEDLVGNQTSISSNIEVRAR